MCVCVGGGGGGAPKAIKTATNHAVLYGVCIYIGGGGEGG